MADDGSELSAILKKRREKTDSDIRHGRFYDPIKNKKDITINRIVEPTPRSEWKAPTIAPLSFRSFYVPLRSPPGRRDVCKDAALDRFSTSDAVRLRRYASEKHLDKAAPASTVTVSQKEDDGFAPRRSNDNQAIEKGIHLNIFHSIDADSFSKDRQPAAEDELVSPARSDVNNSGLDNQENEVEIKIKTSEKEEFDLEQSTEYQNEALENEAINTILNYELFGDPPKSPSKIGKVAKELRDTETIYCEKLRHLAYDYSQALNREDAPFALRFLREDIFTNCQDLHEFHSGRFLLALTAAGNNPDQIAEAFTQHEEELSMYVKYSIKNNNAAKFASEYIDFFTVIQKECGQNMDIRSFLVEPIQRMPRYEMLLKSLLKQCIQDDGGTFAEKEATVDKVEAALAVVKTILRKSNDAVAVAGIVDSQIELGEQGELLRQREFIVSDPLKRKTPMRVFLFEKALVFTVPADGERFRFEFAMDVRTLGLTAGGPANGRLRVWSGTRDGSPHCLRADPADCCAWERDVAALLWRQAELEKEELQRSKRARELPAGRADGEPRRSSRHELSRSTSERASVPFLDLASEDTRDPSEEVVSALPVDLAPEDAPYPDRGVDDTRAQD